MEFRFYINGTEVSEPVGFDATKIKLKRSENWHGVMSESSEETVEFYGSAFTILSALYAESGIDAVAVLKIEYYCNDELQESIEYNITFYEYEEFCGNDCYCKVGIEKSGCYYQFVNGMETKVDLDALKAIDNTTDLADYEYLGKEIEVPSKTIVLKSNLSTSEEITEDISTDYNTYFSTGSTTGLSQVAFFLPYDLITLDEINETASDIDWSANFDSISDADIENNYTLKNVSSPIQCTSNVFNISVKSSGSVIFTTSASITNPASLATFNIFKMDSGGTRTMVYQQTLSNTGSGFDYIYAWDVTHLNTVTLNTGDFLYAYVFLNINRTTTGTFTDFITTHEIDNYFNIELASLCDPTNVKLYLVNETLSHISEYLTNNCLRVYSEYLGRTDSSPYNFAEDGCGGMLALTTGLFLRRIEDVKIGDEAPKFTLSFNDVINAVNAIYPIGFSIETQGNDEIIRIEDWQYFYNDEVITDIGTVSIRKTPNLKLHFKNFKTGYNKYEAEEYNGLDEFLTEREYTTTLINHNATLDKVCQFIASGYAIEITRRKGNVDSKDWRFDNDTFILALDRNYTELAVEQGNIVNDANIVDASTILNYRISPARMAMQWFKYLTTFLKTTKELIFSSGKGNTAAEGELVSVCEIESGVISEKQNLTQPNFITDQTGIYLAELHTVESVPFTFQQYKLLKANPHGLIAYKCDTTQLYGWIQEVNYSFVDGAIDLSLIPKNI